MAKKKEREPIDIFPEIFDISPFINRDHPTLYPYSQEYEDYWYEEERKIVEGIWGLDKKGDKGGHRYAPGHLYFMWSLGTMIHEKGNTNVEIAPIPRDTDFVMDYGYMSARGFSGFQWDEHNTCNRVIRELEEHGYKEISPEYKMFLEEHESVLRGKKTEWKKYIDPITYLYQTFDEPLGKALYNNEALNMILMGPRGYGKSWKAAHWMRYEYTISGLRDYDTLVKDGMPPIEMMIMSSITGKTGETLDKFEKINKHLEMLGSWGNDEDFIPGFFHMNTTGTLDNNNIKKPYTHKYSVQEGGKWRKAGTNNKIFNVVVTVANPDQGAGPRPIVILHEEAGLCKNGKEVSAVNQNSLRRETKIGTELEVATGGNFTKIGYLKKKWSNIRANKCVEYPDIYRGTNKPIGCFIPKTHVKLKFKDENGNTDVAMALAQELHTRKELEEAGDIDVLNSWIVYNCLDPEEMFGASKGNIFPTDQMSKRLFHIESKYTEYLQKWNIGNFSDSGGMLTFHDDISFEPRLYRNPYEDEKKSNDYGVEIFQKPRHNSGMDEFIFNPYKIVLDAVKDDGGGTSQTAVRVYKGYDGDLEIDEFSGSIVAAYTGRTHDVEDTYVITIQLAKYYRAKVLFENNIYDFAKWCYRNGYGEYLQPTPWLAIDKQIESASRKYKVGVNIQGELKNYCTRLFKVKATEKIIDEETGDSIMWVERLHDIRLLYEMTFFGELRNYDAISVMLILMLWLDQEKDPRLLKMAGKDNSKNTFLSSLVEKKNENYEFEWGTY